MFDESEVKIFLVSSSLPEAVAVCRLLNINFFVTVVVVVVVVAVAVVFCVFIWILA